MTDHDSQFYSAECESNCDFNTGGTLESLVSLGWDLDEHIFKLPRVTASEEEEGLTVPELESGNLATVSFCK